MKTENFKLKLTLFCWHVWNNKHWLKGKIGESVRYDGFTRSQLVSLSRFNNFFFINNYLLNICFTKVCFANQKSLFIWPYPSQPFMQRYVSLFLKSFEVSIHHYTQKKIQTKHRITPIISIIANLLNFFIRYLLISLKICVFLVRNYFSLLFKVQVFC